MEKILEVADVRQSFRVGFWLKRLEILRGVSLEVPRRSIFGFLGANGAGKTTLINLIVGLRTATSGTVRVLGLDAASAEARAKIGYLPERPYFHEHLTGRSLLAYFGALSGMSVEAIKKRTPIVLGLVGLSDAADRELKRYSKGMLQRVGIAQALLHDPEFLVLDEPMSGLDPTGRREMRELILKLASEGHTVFFSSHVIPDVEAVCDHVALIRKGEILGSGRISDFLKDRKSGMAIEFSGIPIDKARAEVPGLAECREVPGGGIHGVIEIPEKSGAALKKVLSLGGQIRSFNPIKPSLESFFEEKATS